MGAAQQGGLRMWASVGEKASRRARWTGVTLMLSCMQGCIFIYQENKITPWTGVTLVLLFTHNRGVYLLRKKMEEEHNRQAQHLWYLAH